MPEHSQSVRLAAQGLYIAAAKMMARMVKSQTGRSICLGEALRAMLEADCLEWSQQLPICVESKPAGVSSFPGSSSDVNVVPAVHTIAMNLLGRTCWHDATVHMHELELGDLHRCMLYNQNTEPMLVFDMPGFPLL